jgi:hypothetical protein
MADISREERIARLMRMLKGKSHFDLIEFLDVALENREQVLKAIPPCPVHGDTCVPHALQWIKQQRDNIRVCTEKEAV